MGLAHFNITHVTPCNFQAIHMKPRYNEVTILDVTCNTNSSRLAFGFSVGVNGEMKNYVQRRGIVTEPANAVKQSVPGCEEGKKRKPKSVRKPERQSSTILVNLLDEITIVEPLPKKMKH